jgi:hypothetical protein
MSGQRQAFGSPGRFNAAALPPGGGGGTTVQIMGNLIAGAVTGETFSVVGTLQGDQDNFNPAPNELGKGWLGVAALTYAIRIGSTTADRLRAGADNADAVAVNTIGALLTLARNTGFNGTTWDRLRSAGDNADAVAVATLGQLLMLARNTVFNGTAWDRQRSGSAATLGALTSLGAGLVSDPGNWSINHVPAAATQATITRAAGGAGVRHVCTSIDAALVLPATANQAVITLNLRDGATGAGTILWSRRFGIGAANAADAQQEVSLSGLKIVGTANTAMTLEFSAAGAATTLQSVALTGHDAS